MAKARILMVDDDKVLVAATKVVLESKGYQVSTAYDGDEGLAKAKAEKPDLILLDIIMPTQDGFTVCEQIKSDPEMEKIPILIMTSFAQDKGKTNIPANAGLSLEAEGYVDKPVSPEQLLGLIEKMLASSS